MNEAALYHLIEGQAEHISQISKGFGRETAAIQVAAGSPLVEELLHIQVCNQIEVFLPEDWLDMSTDIALVAGIGGQFDHRLCVYLQPLVHSISNRDERTAVPTPHC